MKAIRWLVPAAVSTVLLSGCATTTGAAASTRAGGGYRLYAADPEAANGPITVIDAASGRTERTLPVGTPSADWSRLYVVASDATRTRLQAIDTHTGNVVTQISFDGTFVLPLATSTGQTGGLSPNGQWLVAQSAGLRNQTVFMLVSTAFTERPRRISLTGDFSFDAISNDGKRLYLIESLASSQPGHYRVRFYDVDAGFLHPQVIVDKREIESASMTGTRISGVFAPDGRWQYSLYINQSTGAFIHALNLEGLFAWCIDLPPGGTQHDQMMWSLAMSPSGNALFAVNPTLGKVARVDITPDGPANEVSQASSFDPARPTSQAFGFFTDAFAKGMQMGSAALTGDGKTLIATGDTGTVAIEVADLKLNRQLLADPAVESVVMSDDGVALFASSWNGPTVFEVNPTTGARLKVLHTDSAWILYRAEHRR